MFRNRGLFCTGQSRLQRLCNGCRDVAFNHENVSQFPIVSLCPQMRIIRGC